MKTWNAGTKHTNEERGGGRDPGARRPGAGRGQRPALSKIFRAAIDSVFMDLTDCVNGVTHSNTQMR